jgi:hypothetical protein
VRGLASRDDPRRQARAGARHAPFTIDGVLDCSGLALSVNGIAAETARRRPSRT